MTPTVDTPTLAPNIRAKLLGAHVAVCLVLECHVATYIVAGNGSCPSCGGIGPTLGELKDVGR